jgi:hypothetical protein
MSSSALAVAPVGVRASQMIAVPVGTGDRQHDLLGAIHRRHGGHRPRHALAGGASGAGQRERCGRRERVVCGCDALPHAVGGRRPDTWEKAQRAVPGERVARVVTHAAEGEDILHVGALDETGPGEQLVLHTGFREGQLKVD